MYHYAHYSQTRKRTMSETDSLNTRQIHWKIINRCCFSRGYPPNLASPGRFPGLSLCILGVHLYLQLAISSLDSWRNLFNSSDMFLILCNAETQRAVSTCLVVSRKFVSSTLITQQPITFSYFSIKRRPTNPNFWHFQKKKKQKEGNYVVKPLFP